MQITCAKKLPLLFMRLLYVQLLEGTEQRRVCVSRYDRSAQKSRQKVSTKGALRLCW